MKLYEIFKNEEVTLIISGIGPFESAIATTYLLTQYNAGISDIFMNIGICGSKKEDRKIGSIFLCNKIINSDTKRTYYPDVLVKHPFIEGALETFSAVINKEKKKIIVGDLVDMEGAGAFQAASSFLPPHNIYVIKIVSDLLDGESVTPKFVSQMINENISIICNFIKEIDKINTTSKKVLIEEEEEVLNRICKNLRLTSTMEYQLKDLSIQYKIREGGLLNKLESFLKVSCKDKKERKMHFERLKEKLMEC
ncbi:5'-methylthioadenosine/S-adenosylhomocysteine nucleosidase family protein [Crassaminicella thermophila]|uniref:5'-methylthioadenosine/S-adenosylhomocysteine nucleosidase family protein n=1 Tax=Crassaminicella thermophila TaxID=2599308 RepID=UPI00143CFA74|nr:5'-methylthioadenosine/S-adenosylhomocysteine nucleosidase [Crassaminicella thermophila]